MRNKKLKIALIICSVLLLVELVFVGFMHISGRDQNVTLDVPEETPSVTETSQAPVTEETTMATEADTEPSEEETTDSTEAAIGETEPTEQRYMLTFVGDCTLASSATKYGSTGSFIQVIGEDYEYPFRNVASYFENDDFTMINLESVLADSTSGAAAGKTFIFRGPTAYTQILTSSSVEAVTLANNHTEDYGTTGYNSTKAALEDAGVSYVEKNGIMLYTTESGLTIGVYAASFDISVSDMRSDIAKLRNQGAEIVVAALHFGSEGKYRPTSQQQSDAHAAIDAGADIVYGHHPHVLQKIEEYNGGIIYYSLGNFSFGGNHFPRDMDSVIVRQEVIRDENGNVSLGELTLIPVSISSNSSQNNFQPTPYEEGSEEYQRAMSKLNGTFTGADLDVDYSYLNPTEGSDTTQPTEGTTGDTGFDGGSDTGSDTGSENPGGTGGDTGSDTGSEGADTGSGGDSGSSGDSGSGGGSSGDPAGDSGGASGDAGGAEG